MSSGPVWPASNRAMGKKMKRTLFYELCASILVAALLAGFNTFAGQSSDVDKTFTLRLAKTGTIATNQAGGRGHSPRQDIVR